MKKLVFIATTSVVICLLTLFLVGKDHNINPKRNVGEVIDSLNNVHVYFNGGVGHTEGRSITKDGYNLGLKYQCVEFVKRYYWKHYNHKMPDSYGNAKDFFNPSLPHATLNKQRNLFQYKNGNHTKPMIGDLLIYEPSPLNKYGHVAIISKVNEEEIEIIQQNPGPFGDSRELFKLTVTDGKFTIKNTRVLGWLRKK